MAMPPALSGSGPNGNMDAPGSQVLGAQDLFSNVGQAISICLSTTLHVSVGTGNQTRFVCIILCLKMRAKATSQRAYRAAGHMK